ncbi:hypothetical protein [Tunturiibacter lichenicola]|uniref:hypothetical protein n=1 Tax=Tunturiibacter lichenicola TaxID=2051959 RepID=UPI003D9AEE08
MTSSKPLRFLGAANLIFTITLSIGLSLVAYSLLILLMPTQLGVDQYWCMYAAKQMLGGVQLDGPRLVETNPPLYVWFSLVPAELAGITKLSFTFAYELISTIVALAGCYLAIDIEWRIVGNTKRLFFVCLAVCTVVTELFLLQRRPGEISSTMTNFGQKEYFVVVLLLPYVLGVLGDILPTMTNGRRILIGFFAGLAICLKPHQVLVVLLVQVAVLVWNKRLTGLVTIENGSLIATSAAYIPLIVLFSPSYMPQILPMMLDTYWAMGTHSAWFLFAHQNVHHFELLATALVICVALRKHMKTPRCSFGLLVCSLGSSLAYDLQHTGWAYQQLPAWAFLILATLWMASDLTCTWVVKHGIRVRVSRAVVGLLVVAGTASLLYNARRLTVQKDRSLSTVSTIAKELLPCPPGTSVYLISVSMPPFKVILDQNLVWGSRFAHLWMVPALTLNEEAHREPGRPFKSMSPTTRLQLTRDLQSAIVADIASWKPKLIFVARADNALPAGANALDWLRQNSAFDAEWENYSKVKTVANADGSVREAYDEYVRID